MRPLRRSCRLFPRNLLFLILSLLFLPTLPTMICYSRLLVKNEQVVMSKQPPTYHIMSNVINVPISLPAVVLTRPTANQCAGRSTPPTYHIMSNVINVPISLPAVVLTRPTANQCAGRSTYVALVIPNDEHRFHQIGLTSSHVYK
jgi:hypothetical protein